MASEHKAIVKQARAYFLPCAVKIFTEVKIIPSGKSPKPDIIFQNEENEWVIVEAKLRQSDLSNCINKKTYEKYFPYCNYLYLAFPSTIKIQSTVSPYCGILLLDEKKGPILSRHPKKREIIYTPFENKKADNTIGNNLFRIRNFKNFSVEYVAARSGLAFSTIYKIQSGANIPDIESLMRLAKALEVPLSDLIGEQT